MTELGIVVLEGLDGVGKTSVARELVRISGGVDITAMVASEVRVELHRRLLLSGAAELRYHYWLWINHLAGERALEAKRRGVTAVIDSYVFRTLVSHALLGVEVAESAVLSRVPWPDRAVLLTADEAVRLRRLRTRDGAGGKNAWHDFVAEHGGNVLAGYRRFGMYEVDTTGIEPMAVAKRIADAGDACRFGLWA